MLALDAGRFGLLNSRNSWTPEHCVPSEYGHLVIFLLICDISLPSYDLSLISNLLHIHAIIALNSYGLAIWIWSCQICRMSEDLVQSRNSIRPQCLPFPLPTPAIICVVPWVLLILPFHYTQPVGHAAFLGKASNSFSCFHRFTRFFNLNVFHQVIHTFRGKRSGKSGLYSAFLFEPQ